ncbi:hypothetical protein [Actinomadura craniellae]|uniref:hypothetical protein n=1 Tax=Actinomadura craniellae TaxID=2231787 RepID=UPI001314C165|nr:hypothetical protein [Actinomadura craniellae]
MFPQPKKYGRYVAAAVFVVFAIQSPEAAALLVKQAGGLALGLAESLGTFVEAFQ